MPPNSSHACDFGATRAQPAFRNGFRCINGSVSRSNPPQVASPGRTWTRFLDLRAIPAAGNITPGSTRYFQCWYQNPAGGGAGFNWSDGLRLTFCN